MWIPNEGLSQGETAMSKAVKGALIALALSVLSKLIVDKIEKKF